MKTLTLDQYALLLEYAAEAKGSTVAEAMLKELREEDDSASKLAVLNVIGRELVGIA